jgi:hypothetical protein
LLVESEPGQAEKETERLDALTSRDHSGQDAVEERKSERRGRRLRGTWRCHWQRPRFSQFLDTR